MAHAGWAYDAYPKLNRLKAKGQMEVAYLKGPAVITALHTTQHAFMERGDKAKREAARGLVLVIYFDDTPLPSVQVPLSDFFADGCFAKACNFHSAFVEKAPGSYNAFFPMPFAKSARILLRNDLEKDFSNYFFVEYETLPRWDPDLGYFHATWRRFSFQCTPDTRVPVITLEGPGHLLGRSWSITTDEPLFRNFHWIMEANNEVRLDTSEPRGFGPYEPGKGPAYDYLGTEDSFGFSWGFREVFCSPRRGMNHLKQDKPPFQLSIYRFRIGDLLRFRKFLDWRLNWKWEFRTNPPIREQVKERAKSGGTWVDYSVTYYWYKRTPGFRHEPLPPVQQRCKEVLHSNP